MWPSWLNLADFLVGVVVGAGVVFLVMVIVMERAERRLRPQDGWKAPESRSRW